MSILHAIVLGVVQGLTEFLPISSSGHLDLVPWLFGWRELSRQPELDKTFDVALHLGTFVGAIAYFAPDVWRYARAAFGSILRRSVNGTDERVAWLLLVSTVPAACVGALANDLIEKRLSREWLIGVLLVVFGLVLYLADRLPAHREAEGFRVSDALIMGTAQALALAPGVSRSGVTISAARWLGFNRDAAARLSFLMSIPIIAGAGLSKGIDSATGSGIPPDFVPAFVVGMISAAFTGWLAVWGTLRLVRTHSFTPFVTYRVVVGLAVITIAAAGWR
jgi:undecaprenyl-diphosphatase